MKHAISIPIISLATIMLGLASINNSLAIKSVAKSVPALPPRPVSKAISNVGMTTPDYELSAAADAGKATGEIADTMPANPAERSQDDSGTAVVSESQSNTNLQQVSTSPVYQPPIIAEQMLAASNRYVIRSLSPELTAAAQRYADYLYASRQQGHYANGMPWDRVRQAGFTGTILFNERLGDWYWTGASYKRVVHHDVGEVLCFGGQSVADAFAGWLKSDGHRAALMEPSFDVAGFGQRGTVWVGLFGNSRQPAVARSETGAGSSYPKPSRALPRAVYQPVRSSCPGGVCGQAFYPQRQYVQQPQQWQYQRPGLFGRRR